MPGIMPPPASPPAPGTVGFRQDGWEVEYLGFDASARPTALRAVRPGVRVRAIIDRWEERPELAGEPPGNTP